jgi:hypothetical protein
MYVAEALGGSWSVRTDADQGALNPPLASVSLTGATLTSGTPIETLVTQPFTVVLEPLPAIGNMTVARLAAGLEDAMYEAFRVGVGLGRPARIPLWDFSGEEPKRSASDFMRVVDFTCANKPDPANVNRVTVTAELRCTWRRRGRVENYSKTVEAVRLVGEGR